MHIFVFLYSCQWVDVTSINTAVNTYTTEFQSYLNPDNFICEGTPYDDTWIETTFKTTCCNGTGCCGDTPATTCCGGLPVERQKCATWKGADKDNAAKLTVTIPLNGEGLVTADCANSSGKWGEKRDCGFRLHSQGKMLTCSTPGQSAMIKQVTASTFYQVFRELLLRLLCIFCNYRW